MGGGKVDVPLDAVSLLQHEPVVELRPRMPLVCPEPVIVSGG
jgi:hypothetical protein